MELEPLQPEVATSRESEVPTPVLERQEDKDKHLLNNSTTESPDLVENSLTALSENSASIRKKTKKKKKKCCGIMSGKEKDKDLLDGGNFESRSLGVPIEGEMGDDPEVAIKQNDDFDVNMYATKKTAANGLLDLALLMANASQLKHILLTEGEHVFYYPMLFLLIFSILVQVIVGLGLLYLARVNISDLPGSNVVDKRRTADRINNWVVAGIFLLTVVNVFISAFGLNEKRK